MGGKQVPSSAYDALSTEETSQSIFPWQWGQLGLTEDGGNRLIKYADAIVEGVRSSYPTITFLKNLMKTLFFPCAFAEPQASPNDGTLSRFA